MIYFHKSKEYSHSLKKIYQSLLIDKEFKIRDEGCEARSRYDAHLPVMLIRIKIVGFFFTLVRGTLTLTLEEFIWNYLMFMIP